MIYGHSVLSFVKPSDSDNVKTFLSLPTKVPPEQKHALLSGFYGEQVINVHGMFSFEGLVQQLLAIFKLSFL